MSWALSIEALPAGWECTKLKACLSRQKRYDRIDLPLLSVNLPRGVVLREEGDGRPAPSQDLSGYQEVRPGDLVMNQLGKPHGALGVSDYHGIISPAYFVAAIGERAEPRFLHHLLRTRLYISEYERRGKYMPPSQFDISWERFRDIDVALPPVAEQRAIADYLDTETTRIDALITKKRRMIELLDERRRLVVSATLWESDWPKVRLKYLCGVPTSGNREHGSFTPDDTGVPCLRGLNVRPGRLDLHNLLKISDADHFRLWATQLDPGDLVIVRSGLAGSAAVIPEDFGPCNCVDVVVVRRSDAIAPRLLEYLINSCEAQEQVTRHSAGALLTHFNAVDAGNLALPVPPLEVQPSILADLEKSSAHFSQITAALERQISLLAEHRQALITAAVTGELGNPLAA